jgi:hypothetical protein
VSTILIKLQESVIILQTRIAFSKWQYIVLTGTITAIFWVVFNIFNQLLFFSPILIFYLPEDAIIDFILSDITSILMGMVISMDVYFY